MRLTVPCFARKPWVWTLFPLKSICLFVWKYGRKIPWSMPQDMLNSQTHPTIIASWSVIFYQKKCFAVVCDKLLFWLYFWCLSYIPFTSDWRAIQLQLTLDWHAFKIPLIRIIKQISYSQPSENYIVIIWFGYAEIHYPKMIHIIVYSGLKSSKEDHHSVILSGLYSFMELLSVGDGCIYLKAIWITLDNP